MSDYWDEQLSPRPTRHAAAGFPYPMDSTGDVHPETPDVADDFPYPADSSGDVLPKADRHDGDMNLNLGRTVQSL